MTSVAVAHMDLMAKGGGEAVCMNVLDALEDEYDTTLFTLTEPDLPALNEYFNTNVESITVRQAGRFAPFINQRWGLKYYILQNALLGRYVKRQADEFDLLFSTINELGLGDNAVQYIHFPFDWAVNLDIREEIFHPTVKEESLYEKLCTMVGGVDETELRSNTLLANSRWTASVVADAYGVEPDVLYPPIDTTEFVNRPWSEREFGFVTIGRIERSKRISELIEIIDRLRERGHDLHLHVVGPTVDGTYQREVDALAASREHVRLEGEVSRSRLVELACTHRYGIHGKEYEHFGMAVAELAAGGTIPFVPATGGQHAIVDDREELLYESVDDAVEKIDSVLSDPALQRTLRMGSRTIRRRFGRERFKETVRSVVAGALGEPSETTTEPTVEVPHGSQSIGND